MSLQLDHINGINNDHRLENLRWLCPNCHAITDTFAGKNKNSRITDEQLITVLAESYDIYDAIKKVGSNDYKIYERAKKLIENNLVSLKAIDISEEVELNSTEIKIEKDKEKKEVKKNYCLDCGIEITKNATRCSKCY